MSLYRRPRRGPNALYFVGWLLVVGVGIWLVWYGFTWTGEGEQPESTPVPSAAGPATPEATIPPTFSPLPPGMASILRTPTIPPLPTATPLPTAIPATPTAATPYMVAGADGVNVRTGPGITYTRLGYLDPGAQAELIGRYGDWWQIRYGDAQGWVFGQLVTPYNGDNVPQVEPPPAPTVPPVSPTPVPTAPPPTPTPADTRGLSANKYWVENAPGPFAVGGDIWFNMDITNGGGEIAYTALGTWVEETGDFQRSWSDSSFYAGQHFTWRDKINQFTLQPGTYHLWLRVCFTDGACVNLKGPVVITVQ